VGLKCLFAVLWALLSARFRRTLVGLK